MKILLLQDRLRSGGTERQTLTLARAFRDAGHDAQVLTFRPGGDLAQAANDVSLDPLQSFDTGLDWFAPGLINRIREIRPQVVLPMGRMANCYAGLVQSRIPQLSVVATMRTGKSLPFLYRRSLRRVRQVVANSHQSAQTLRDTYGVPLEKIHVIHNALVFSPEIRKQTGAPEASVRAEQGAGVDTRVLLCVAMLRKEKNHRDLVTAVQRLPKDVDWQLWIVGEGETRQSLEAQVAQAGLQARVKFLGFQKDPTPFYRGAELAVLTSQAESLSNFLIEAQAHGLPAVAFDVQGVRECFLHGSTGFAVPFGDTAELAGKIERLLKDRDLCNQFSSEARHHARLAFSSNEQARQYLELFQALAGGV